MNDILRPSPPAPPPRLFQRLRWRLLRNSTRVLLRQSWLRVFVILGCSLLVWGTIFTVSLLGFRFLQDKGLPLVGGLVGMLFDLLFFALSVMLIFSSGIILYSSLFASSEATFLLSTPARADQVFGYKYQGAVAFSSWAFVLLGSPILLGYGLVYEAPWTFYVLVPLFFLGYVLLPGCIGALVCLLLVNYLPRQRKQVLVVALALAVAVSAFWLYRLGRAARTDTWSRDAVQLLVGRFTFAQGMFLPSHWMAQGLQRAVRGDLLGGQNGRGALYYLALLWSNGLFLYVLTAWVAARLYRRGYNRIATGGSLRRRYGGGWLDTGLSRLLLFVDPQTRLLIVKDWRTFRRDPAQWAQILIFTGLLVLYFTNLQRLHLREITWTYRTGISLLNLTATSLLLCTYTSRFIYPMLSLEGRKFWVLGLLPLQRDRLLWGKFAFSATGSLLIAESLVLLSDLMLVMPWQAVLLHVLAVAALTVGLSGLSVGLGACLPNFRETDPSKIAVGFGGTLNLVAGLLFLVLTITAMAAPWHVLTAGADDGFAAQLSWPAVGLVAAGVAVGLVLTAGAVVVPLRLGARTLRGMEF